ncbi:PREDICTED: uncharacterized protein LOC104745886 isoform X2 [Camelina sativa]|uniref:Uncharacterized protein LOC104745886 isoform X2 n=1 Tax=Camelina sativa TaxID=90675 RepID=A0ABM1R0R9_CAMSA|nr:PREDICTED: uncharacterized protein LOC104745886 isoform X2 [Camelina sativa]
MAKERKLSELDNYSVGSLFTFSLKNKVVDLVFILRESKTCGLFSPSLQPPQSPIFNSGCETTIERDTMAMSLMNRAISRTETVGAFRLSFNLLRNFSASPAASPPSSENPSSDANKPKRRKKKNLIEVAQLLPNWGIGYHMAKADWNRISYEISKINLYQYGRHGKAWGIVHKDESLHLSLSL